MSISPASNNDFVESYIPLDKSWTIRMAILDALYGNNSTRSLEVLEKNEPLSDDLAALQKIIKNWDDDTWDVEESGTLLRILSFINWKNGLNKKFAMSGSLPQRSTTADSNITTLGQSELLNIDNTSQWASAAVLTGNSEKLANPPYKLQLTYEAWEYWHSQKAKNEAWEPRKDDTIRKQALAYLQLLKSEDADFTPEQAEDFPFAFTFGYMSANEGRKLWPTLQNHESNRIVEMPQALEAAKSGQPVLPNDHRVVQALAMWSAVNGVDVQFAHPNAVAKTWPNFWEFIEQSKQLQF